MDDWIEGEPHCDEGAHCPRTDATCNADYLNDDHHRPCCFCGAVLEQRPY